MKEAESFFSKARALDPGNASLREEQAGVAVAAQCIDSAQEALRAGQFERALASANRGLERSPGCDLLHYTKCRALLGLERAGARDKQSID